MFCDLFWQHGSIAIVGISFVSGCFCGRKKFKHFMRTSKWTASEAQKSQVYCPRMGNKSRDCYGEEIARFFVFCLMILGLDAVKVSG